jgi:hypothetical protein
MSDLLITKSNGDKEYFDPKKLKHSLERSGASEEEIKHTVEYIESKLQPDMTTGDIYALAYKNLNTQQKRNPNAIRYSLKRSVMELGPTGFPFEKFIARIFIELGYECQTGITIKGHCIEHEVDIFAHKGDDVICMEAKFHNEPHLKSDTKVALYVKARFDDLIGQKIKIGEEYKHISRGILVTNTGFTDTARQYASCAGSLELMGWNEPKDKSVLYYIEKYNLYPIGVIPELGKKEIEFMVSRQILLCSDLKKNLEIMNEMEFGKSKQEVIIETIDSICKC